MREALRDYWYQWLAYRQKVHAGRAFLAQPHDRHDPECVKYEDQARHDWKARCPSCNPPEVHFLTEAGAALHAFINPFDPSETYSLDPAEVTCPICRGVLVEAAP